SSNYPNVMILNYLEETKQTQPQIEKRARELLERGYQQITSFECINPKEAAKRKGYEWFGQTAPPHEALTAYGLLQFQDMAKVYAIDKAMVERTRNYLLGQRNAKGGFDRNPRALDSFGGAPEHITNGYITWALTESGTDADLSEQITALKKQAKDSQDPYFLSLVGLSLANRKQTDEALTILKTVAAKQK